MGGLLFYGDPPSFLKKLAYRIRYFEAYKHKPSLSLQEKAWVDNLKKVGYVVIDNLIDTDLLQTMQKELQKTLESLDFKFPCFSQNLIDKKNHADLISNYFYASDAELEKVGLTFTKDEVKCLDDVIKKYNPSTLTAFMLAKSSSYRAVWFDERILRVISSYMGLVPKMVESYVRRNFPSPYKTMNHFWHRDLNHPHHLLKVFIFLSDCKLDNGPHEFIAGSHADYSNLNGKRYYDDTEVDAIFPEGSLDRVVSEVKAGTIIIEDTRGLHRARLPLKDYRDLGYAVFMPSSKNGQSFYSFPKKSYSELSVFQRRFISDKAIS